MFKLNQIQQNISYKSFLEIFCLQKIHKSKHLFCMHACLVASVVSYSLQPHGLRPARLLCPWDSPGKTTGMGCHSCSNAWKWKVKVKSLSPVRLFDPMDCSLPGLSIHRIFQVRVLEWVAICFFKKETQLV